MLNCTKAENISSIKKMPKNIIFILSDQHNPKITGFGGNSVVKTPNLDHLASQGTSHLNCYCASPLCIPSRAAMLSGLLPTKTGVLTNFECLPSDKMTFVHSLGIAGYETVLCGRMHFKGPDQRHGFMRRIMGDIHSPYIGGGLDLGFLEGADEQSRVGLEKSGPGHSSVIDYDRDIFEQAEKFLSSRQAEKPLFLTVGLYGPHCPYVCPKELYDYYYENLPPIENNQSFQESVHSAVKKWYGNRGIAIVTEEETRRARAAYYGLIELMDCSIGRLIETIDKTIGLKETLLIYASDHGDMVGEKGMFWKTNFYEGSARVPMIFSMPGVIQTNKTIKQPTSLLDLGPTLIDVCGGPKLPRTDGENLFDMLKGETEENHNRIVISQLADNKGDNPSAMIRQNDWKLVSHQGYSDPQLFNLEDDPEEVNDQGGNANHHPKKIELLEALSKHWDGEEIAEHLKHSSSHMRLLEKWFEVTQPETFDQWDGKVENNFLISDH